MKTESTAQLGKEKYMMKREREGRHWPWTMFLAFILQLQCFCLLDSSSQVRFWCKAPFLSSPHMGIAIFLGHSVFAAVVQLLSLPHHVFQPTSFQTWIISLLPLCVGGTNISLSAGSTPAQEIWDPQIFLVILITVVIHPWLPDQQRVFLIDIAEVSWPFCRLSVFSSYVFSSLSLSLSLSVHIYIYIYSEISHPLSF